MIDVITAITIDAPVAKISEFASDPDNAPRWYVNIKSAEWKTPKPLQTGSKVAFTAQFLGRKLVYTYEVTIFVPQRKLVMRTAEGPFPMETTYTWEPLDPNSTQMTLRNRGVPTGFSKLFTPILKTMMRKANNKDLRLLKKILESGG